MKVDEIIMPMTRIDQLKWFAQTKCNWKLDQKMITHSSLAVLIVGKVKKIGIILLQTGLGSAVCWNAKIPY